MADSSYTIRDTVPQTDKTIKVIDLGDGAYALALSIVSKIAGANFTNDLLRVEDRYTPQNITMANTTTISGAKFLKSITVNTTAAGAITIYDNTAASGTKIGTLKASIVEGTYTCNSFLATGLTIVTAAASDITISYR